MGDYEAPQVTVPHRTVLLRISGKVQGVWYRSWTVETAEARGLTGWVRNRRDGTVEALISGPNEHVAWMIGQCREGPPMAIVDAIDIQEASPMTLRGFVQRPSV